jgi:hypothetical protein
MDKTVYDKRSFRNLPRETCVVADLFGLDDCHGSIHRHHVDPEDPSSRTLEVCNRHHQHLHKVLRTLAGASERPWKRCTHVHPYPGGREACEAKLNGVDRAA